MSESKSDADSGTGPTVTPELTTDDALSAIGVEARRRIIYALSPGDEVASANLSVLLSRREGAPRPEIVTRSLEHMHLPKLDACGVIDYERSSGLVRTGPNYKLARDLATIVTLAMDHGATVTEVEERDDDE
ncbi:transcriptional regulator [Halalkalicoccus sp. NIPERK01]|uniref:DUF7344 domain-containing protein n=1 Tax=Halalkalicoccus sp. NIPERK01 TaxID=3053469 RepID=UPI00256F1198|nr:transcriptional regulator [Halalkalicoccus sp. NIPERK01]MDL5361319.1 transcriptional regulator [Halalkalicoccus sp. NIPERK01]